MSRNHVLTDILRSSYEGLPPNFSLLQNMAAGAFAGIAVGGPPSMPSRPFFRGASCRGIEHWRLTGAAGTHCHVPN